METCSLLLQVPLWLPIATFYHLVYLLVSLSGGVDFGLDAVTLDKEQNIEFSTEILYENKLDFTDGDVLLRSDGVMIQNIELINAFEPNVGELGLNALSFYLY